MILQSVSLEFIPQNRKLHPHKNLNMDIYSSFSNNCQNLEDTNISFSWWIDKLWYIQTMEY